MLICSSHTAVSLPLVVSAGGVPQPLFPIGSAPAAAQQQAAPVQPIAAAAAPPGGSLFPISLQEPAAASASRLPATSGQPGGPLIAFSSSVSDKTSRRLECSCVEHPWVTRHVYLWFS